MTLGKTLKEEMPIDWVTAQCGVFFSFSNILSFIRVGFLESVWLEEMAMIGFGLR